MGHAIRRVMSNKKFRKVLSGIVEVDETYVGGRRRGSKRGRGVADHKTPVFGMLERGGTLHIMPVERVNRETLQGLIYEHVYEGTKIMSDEFKSYNGLNEYYIHQVINHGVRHYADGEIHVNSLEGAWGLMKRVLKGIYHRPSKKYMFNYCGEFEFKYNNRNKAMSIIFRNTIKQSGIRIKHHELTRER